MHLLTLVESVESVGMSVRMSVRMSVEGCLVLSVSWELIVSVESVESVGMSVEEFQGVRLSWALIVLAEYPHPPY